uniref:Uncharacterized protein n=1 Tax=Trichogramma kaykai TaxID=54128 RepID=A0ABD2WH53_9HYME
MKTTLKSARACCFFCLFFFILISLRLGSSSSNIRGYKLPLRAGNCTLQKKLVPEISTAWLLERERELAYFLSLFSINLKARRRSEAAKKEYEDGRSIGATEQFKSGELYLHSIERGLYVHSKG